MAYGAKTYTLREESTESGKRYFISFKDGQGEHHELEVSEQLFIEFRQMERRNLWYLNWKHRNGFNREEIFKVANSRLGWYRRSGMNVVNFIISKDLLENRIKDGVELLNPLSYYLVKVGI